MSGICKQELERARLRIQELESALHKLRPFFGKLARDQKIPGRIYGSSVWDPVREAFEAIGEEFH